MSEEYFAHKYEEGWKHIYDSKLIAGFCSPSKEIFQIKIRGALDSENSEYWAWKEFERGNNPMKYHNIYPAENLLKMCSPDYFELATSKGEGKIVKIIIEEVGSAKN